MSDRKKVRNLFKYIYLLYYIIFINIRNNEKKYKVLIEINLTLFV